MRAPPFPLLSSHFPCLSFSLSLSLSSVSTILLPLFELSIPSFANYHLFLPRRSHLSANIRLFIYEIDFVLPIYSRAAIAQPSIVLD